MDTPIDPWTYRPIPPIGGTSFTLAYSLLININNEVEVVRQYDFSRRGGLMTMQYRSLKSQAITLPYKFISNTLSKELSS